MQHHKINFFYIILAFFICLSICGCGSSKATQTMQEPPEYSSPHVLVPEAPGTKILDASDLILDISNTDQGYLVAQSDTQNQKINIQLTTPDDVLYSYFLSPGETAVIPFTGGNGTYQIICYLQVQDSQYAALYAETLDVKLENEFFPYLYPNQYVNFSPQSEASKLAMALISRDAQDVEVLEAVYDYVTSNITYDTELAETVEAGYLPDVDQTLKTGKGICFDYAALMAAMLRSRDIPCKLQIGYAGTVKHAWIDVYIRSKGYVNKTIAFNGNSWLRMDPTFESVSTDKESIRSYIENDDNYTLQFTH